MSNKQEAPNNHNLKNRTITGFKWSFLDNAGRFGGQFIIGIILARILSPTDFGLVGMLTIFIVVGESLTNSGFAQALIQKKDTEDIDFSTVFYFNIFSSIIIYLLFILSAPLIAKFYNEPRLIPLTKVICLSFVINSFGLIHTTYLTKKLDFKAQSIVGVLSILSAGVISIIMAYKGFGVWALVANVLLKGFFSSCLYWKISKWRPMLKFSMVSLNGLFSYGSKILLAGIMNSIFKNIYFLIIGRLFLAESLGFYTRAVQFSNLPVNTITSIVQKVTYPVFSSIQDDNKKLISGHSKAIRMLTAIVLPIMVVIFITAKPLIHLVLGEKWLPVVPYLQIMCLYSWIHIIYTLNNLVITAKGRSDYYLQLQIINKILIVISIVLTYRYGIKAMIYGHMISTVLYFIVGSQYVKKVIDITLIAQVKNISPFFISAILMILSNLPLSKYISNEYNYLIFSIGLGAITYLFSLWLMRVRELKSGHYHLSKILKSFQQNK